MKMFFIPKTKPSVKSEDEDNEHCELENGADEIEYAERVSAQQEEQYLLDLENN